MSYSPLDDGRGHNAKRKRAGGRLGGAYNDCLKLIKSLKAHKSAWPFQDPVDPIALNIPDYFTVITRPMDLGTVESNLKDEVYADALEFAADVRQVWANCEKYNGPDHQITQLARQLSEIFEKKFADLRTHSFEEIDERPAKAPKPSGPSSISKPKRPTPQPSYYSGVPTIPLPEMTFEEKRQLCIMINNLDPKHLGKVIHIIHKSAPGVLDGKEAGDDEVEISMEALSANTLRELEQYVKDVRAQHALATPKAE